MKLYVNLEGEGEKRCFNREEKNISVMKDVEWENIGV